MPIDLTDPKIVEILKGRTADAAAALGVSEMTVKRYAAKAGISKSRAVDVDWESQTVRDLFETHSTAEVARILGVSKTHANRHRIRLGIEAHPAEADVPEALLSKLGTMPDTQLSEAFGVSYKVVRARREAAGIPAYQRQATSAPVEPKAPQNPVESSLPPEFFELLGKRDDAELSRTFGVPHSTVREIRIRRGIEAMPGARGAHLRNR